MKVSKLFKKGTLLITIAANIGDIALLDFDCCFPDSIIGINANKKTSNEYLYYVVNSLKQNILKYAKINTQLNINEETIKPVKIPLPPKHIQKEILERIDVLSNQSNKIISNFRKEIEILEEYKKILINDCVTGKMKVTA